MKPFNTKIYIAEVAVEKKTASGIILEGVSSIRETRFAEVLEIGSKVEEVVPGDRIVLDWSKCFPVTIDGKQRAVVDIEDVLGKIDQ